MSNLVTAATIHLECGGRVDLRNALATIRRTRPDVARIDWVFNERKSREDLPVIEVPEGTVLVVTAFSGIPFLHMAAGRVVFDAQSAWGNSMTVHGGELHVRTLSQRQKVTITVEPHAGEQARVTTTAVELQPGARLRYFDHRDRKPVPQVVRDDRGIPMTWATDIAVAAADTLSHAALVEAAREARALDDEHA